MKILVAIGAIVAAATTAYVVQQKSGGRPARTIAPAAQTAQVQNSAPATPQTPPNQQPQNSPPAKAPTTRSSQPQPAPPVPGGPQPRITLSQTKWEFGEVWHLDQPKMDLMVKNEGNAVLTITRVHTSCGCTAAQPEKKILQPGETTPVHVVFNSKGKQGHVTSTVIVYSNDRANPEVSMHIEGTVKRAVVVDPIGGLFVRTLDGNATHTTRCRVTNNEAEPLKVAIKQNGAPAWTFEINEITPGKEAEIVATLKGPVAQGATKGMIVISTGIPREPTVQIPVKVTVLSRIEMVPRAFIFTKEDNKPADRKVNIEYYGDADFQVTGATSSWPGVTCKIMPVKAGGPSGKNMPKAKRVAPVAFSIPAGNELPAEPVIITMTTNDPDYQVLELAITTDSDEYDKWQHSDAPTPMRKLDSASQK